MARVRNSGGSSASRGGRVSREGWRGRGPLIGFGGDGRRIRAQVVSASSNRLVLVANRL
jgi:hypothetical protein